MKLAFLGDSLTWGGYGGNFVDEMARRLPTYTIVNAGVGGNTILNLLNRLDVVMEQQPDGIFVMVGGNDAISYCQPATRRYYERTQNIPGGLVTPQQFAQSYRDLLTRVHLNHMLAWVGLPPCEYSPLVVATLGQYNELAREAAQSLNVPVLDFAARFGNGSRLQHPPLDQAAINLIGTRTRSGWNDYEAERRKGGFTFTFDGFHLTPESAQRMSQWIIEFLGFDQNGS